MNGSNRVFLMLFVLCLWIVASPASAALFMDNFESDTVDTDPVIGAGDTGGSWVVNEDIAGHVNVVAGQYLQLTRRGDTETHPADAHATGWNVASTTNKVVTFSTKLQAASDSADSMLLVFSSTGITEHPAALDMFDIYFATDGVIHFYDRAGNDWSNPTFGYTLGAWHDVAVTLDTTARTFQLQVDSNTDIARSWTGPSHQLGTVTLAAGGPGAEGLFDNVGLVPEPTSLALLATGLLGLLAYAWRKRK